MKKKKITDFIIHIIEKKDPKEPIFTIEDPKYKKFLVFETKQKKEIMRFIFKKNDVFGLLKGILGKVSIEELREHYKVEISEISDM
jgi:hypothetical protein